MMFPVKVDVNTMFWINKVICINFLLVSEVEYRMDGSMIIAMSNGRNYLVEDPETIKLFEKKMSIVRFISPPKGKK